MIKTETRTSDLTKARNAFLNMESEKDNLINKLVNATLEVFKSSTFNQNKNAKSDIGNYDFDIINLYYSFQDEKVVFLTNKQRRDIIIPKNYNNQFYFDNYLNVGELNLSRKKGSALASECFELAKKSYQLNEDDLKLFKKFVENYLLKDLVQIATTFFAKFETKEYYQNVYYSITRGEYPVRFVIDIGDFALSLSKDGVLEHFLNNDSNATFEDLFLKNNRFFSNEQINEIINHINLIRNQNENNEENIVDMFKNLGNLVNSGFFKAEEFVSKFNEEIETDFVKVFNELYLKHDNSLTIRNILTEKRLDEVSDESLILLFRNFMKFYFVEDNNPTAKNNRTRNFKDQIKSVLKIIDKRELIIKECYPISIKVFNSKTFLNSSSIKNLKKICLNVSPEFITSLIGDLSVYFIYGKSSQFNNSYFCHSFYGIQNINSSNYLFDIIEERFLSGTEFFISKDFYKNLEQLINSIDSGLILSADGNIELELKRILKLFKPII